jgi:hypothetical protein
VREQAVVEVSFENEDDFVNNLATLCCECRGVNAIPIPAGGIVGTLPAWSLAAHMNASGAQHNPVHPPQHGKK